MCKHAKGTRPVRPRESCWEAWGGVRAWLGERWLHTGHFINANGFHVLNRLSPTTAVPPPFFLPSSQPSAAGYVQSLACRYVVRWGVEEGS